MEHSVCFLPSSKVLLYEYWLLNIIIYYMDMRQEAIEDFPKNVQKATKTPKKQVSALM